MRRLVELCSGYVDVYDSQPLLLIVPLLSEYKIIALLVHESCACGRWAEYEAWMLSSRY